MQQQSGPNHLNKGNKFWPRSEFSLAIEQYMYTKLKNNGFLLKLDNLWHYKPRFPASPRNTNESNEIESKVWNSL